MARKPLAALPGASDVGNVGRRFRRILRNGTVKIYLGTTLLKKVGRVAARTHHKVVIDVAASARVKTDSGGTA